MTLCVIVGSMKANEQRMKPVKNYLELIGWEVISPWDVPFNHTQDPLEKTKNRQFYYRAIDKCDVIMVLNKKHVGPASNMEIGYALAKGKQILFWDTPDVLEYQSMVMNGEAKYYGGDMEIP